ATGPATANFDGMSFTPLGDRLFVADHHDSALPAGSGEVIGFCTATALCGSAGSILYTSPVIAGNPDGVAIGLGVLSNFLYVNNNNGTVVEINLLTNALVTIATGGSRGDFIATDPAQPSSGFGFPSLLLTQTDTILRLDPPGGGWFGPPTSSTTLEPAI